MKMNIKNIVWKNIHIILLILFIFIIVNLVNRQYENFDDTKPIPSNGVIPDGYYKINDREMKKIPYGYTTNTDKDELLPNTQSAFWVDYVKKEENVQEDPMIINTNTYTPNLDVSYHADEETIKYQSGVYGTSFGTTVVVDNNGNKILIPYNPAQGFPTYYKPGTYKYGANIYVPNYEESIYLSKMNRINKNETNIIKPYEKTKMKYSNVPNKNSIKKVYVKPVYIALSNYVPKNGNTIYSSKTSGLDTTSLYCVK
jgi:hypothetical protein